jgi:hypothetical protein
LSIYEESINVCRLGCQTAEEGVGLVVWMGDRAVECQGSGGWEQTGRQRIDGPAVGDQVMIAWLIGSEMDVAGIGGGLGPTGSLWSVSLDLWWNGR